MGTQPETWTLEEYAMPNAETPVLGFLHGLEGRNKREALALIQLVRERGNQLRFPQSKAVETGLFELRGHQVRIFYMFLAGGRVVLLDGTIKKQDEIPEE